MKKSFNSDEEYTDLAERSNILVLKVGATSPNVRKEKKKYNPVYLLAGGELNPEYNPKPRRYLE